MDDLFERTILIVDDEAVNREILGNIIQSEYKVIYAENGKEALEKNSFKRLGNFSCVA